VTHRVILTLLSVLTLALLQMPNALADIGVDMEPGTAKPPGELYIDKGACPFECCTYTGDNNSNKWKVTAKTKVYDKIGSKKVVAVLLPGQMINAPTGEVHTKPTHLRMTKDYNDFKAGQDIYVLTSSGEGYFKIWHNGHYYEDDTITCVMYEDPYAEEMDEKHYCYQAKTSSEVVSRGHSDWWVQIKLKNGKRGWALVGDNFTNNDACG
jgi:hypothetical protein